MKIVILVACLLLSVFVRAQSVDDCSKYWALAKSSVVGDYKSDLREEIKYCSLIINHCRDSSAYLQKGDCYINLGCALKETDFDSKGPPGIAEALFEKAVSDTLFKGLSFVNKAFKYYLDTISLIPYRAKAEEAIAKNVFQFTQGKEDLYHSWLWKSEADLELYNKLHTLYPRGSQFMNDSFSIIGDGSIYWDLPDTLAYQTYGYKKEYYNQTRLAGETGASTPLLGHKEYWISEVNKFIQNGGFKSESMQYSHFYPDKTKANHTSTYAIWQWNVEYIYDATDIKVGDYIKGTFLIDKNDRIISAVFTGATNDLMWFFLNYLYTAEFNVIANDGKYLEEKKGLTISKAAYELKGKRATETDYSEIFTIDFTSPDKKVKVTITKK